MSFVKYRSVYYYTLWIDNFICFIVRNWVQMEDDTFLRLYFEYLIFYIILHINPQIHSRTMGIYQVKIYYYSIFLTYLLRRWWRWCEIKSTCLFNSFTQCLYFTYHLTLCYVILYAYWNKASMPTQSENRM